MNDLEYRRKQLLKLQESVIDLEDLSSGVSIADLTLNDFRVDLSGFLREHPDALDQAPLGAFAAISLQSGADGDNGIPPGIIFCLRAEGEAVGNIVEPGYPLALVDGIKYQRIGDDVYYAQELFETEELTGYLHKNMLEAKKSVYEYVVYDSGGIEKTFAEQLEMNEAVKVFAKLPSWFKVPTPLGTYNPDWAVLVNEDGKEKLYFVVETKGSLFTGDLRNKEGAKIACGMAHFDVLAKAAKESRISPAKYLVARSVDDMLKHCTE